MYLISFAHSLHISIVNLIVYHLVVSIRFFFVRRIFQSVNNTAFFCFPAFGSVSLTLYDMCVIREWVEQRPSFVTRNIHATDANEIQTLICLLSEMGSRRTHWKQPKCNSRSFSPFTQSFSVQVFPLFSILEHTLLLCILRISTHKLNTGYKKRASNNNNNKNQKRTHTKTASSLKSNQRKCQL